MLAEPPRTRPWFSLFVRPRQLFFLSLSILAFISAIVIPYWEGRTNDVSLLLAELVPPLILLFSAAFLFCCWIASIVKKRKILASTAMFWVACMLLFGWFVPFHFSENIYLLGLRNYTKNVLTPEEWRTIARLAQANMKPGQQFLGGRPDNSGEQKVWADTQIQKLAPDPAIWVPVAGSTEIEWGSALVGHRGIIIYSDTNDMPPPADVYLGPSFIAPDIAAFIEAH